MQIEDIESRIQDVEQKIEDLKEIVSSLGKILGKYLYEDEWVSKEEFEKRTAEDKKKYKEMLDRLSKREATTITELEEPF